MSTPWSIVLIPDTQNLATPANGWTSYYTGMRDWIIDNAPTYNVQLVASVGDSVDLHGDSASWDNAQAALLPLTTALDIPVLLLAAGNHDSDAGNLPRSLSIYNTRFPVSLYSGKSWYGGVYETGKAQNLWGQFNVGGTDYLVFMFEFYPRDGVLDWADGVVAAHPGHKVIVVTHAFLYQDGARDDWSTAPWGVSSYFTVGSDANPGADMWSGWLKDWPNLVGVFNGHHIPNNVAYRVDPGTAGNMVLQAFYNWQDAETGGRGRVILLTVDEDAGTIHQQVVRPDLDAFETGTSGSFSYDTVHSLSGPAVPAVGVAGRVMVDGTPRPIKVYDGTSAVSRIAKVGRSA